MCCVICIFSGKNADRQKAKGPIKLKKITVRVILTNVWEQLSETNGKIRATLKDMGFDESNANLEVVWVAVD